MAVLFDKEKRIFKLDTKNTSYVFCVSDYETVEHLYYGEKICDTDIKSISNRQIYTFASHEVRTDRTFVQSTIPSEYPVFSNGDFRTPAVVFDGNTSKRFRYASHEILSGKPEIQNLPSSRDYGNAETLKVSLINDDKTVEIDLYYSVYETENVICRHTEIKNLGNAQLILKKAVSGCLDFYESDFSFVTLEGMYLAERSQVNERKLCKGLQGSRSLVGASSHHANPFFALKENGTTETSGNAYGFNLVYSSNFHNEIEVDRLGATRVLSGIDETGFSYSVEPNGLFATPEWVMTFSTEGLGGVSRNMHDHIRQNIIDRKYLTASRPIVINSWEAMYFAVNEEKLLSLAEKAKKCGADTLVLDDGWFRDNDNSGLGDWKTVKEKFLSLAKFSEKIHSLGLKFGIWVEPEMVAVESEFYRKHPTEILNTEKEPTYSRNQFLLDLTKKENVEYMANRIIDELKGVEIDYIKWDYNRYITEIGSTSTPTGEIYFRQMTGAYALLQKITSAFPNAIFETCSGGGGRFDLGMLYFSPQIWTSDNTDPYERLYIEYGTSVAYPTSSVSCHFSEGNCTSGRPSSYAFRYAVASFGPYGYELDLNKYSDEELEKFKALTDTYKQNEAFVLNADLYRIMSPETDTFCAYMQVTKDKQKALLTFHEINTRGLTESMVIHLYGLDENTLYKNEQTGVVLSGKAWKNVGIRMGNLFREKGGSSRQILFTAVK